MKTPLEMSRTRLVNTYLAEIVRERGAMVAALKLPDGSITTIQVDADILTKALKKLFEAAVHKVSPGDAGDREIAETYGDCVRIKTGKMTEIGAGFMGALISNLVELASAGKAIK